MSQSITLAVKGLHTYASDISGVPSGSFYVANNVNINRTGTIEPRRGFDQLTYALPLSTDRPKKLVFWNSEVFCHYGSTFSYYDDSSGFSSRGSLTAPSNATSARMIASQNKNLYLTSDAGLKKTDAITSSIYAAGIPKGLTIDLSVAGAGTAIENNQYATYTYLIGRRDGNGNIQLGGIAGMFTIQNTAGSTQNITAKCYIPSGLDTSHFIQLYRSASSATTPPVGEPQLVNETNISSADISAGYISLTDVAPDSFLGATIYTAPSQQGIANDNAQPPLARDIAEFKDCMFYADVESKHKLTFNLISAGGTGLVASDTITITMGATVEVYTAHATTFDASAKQFIVSTGGSVSQNIDATIKSFIKCVNLASAIVVGYAIPESALNPLPGKVMLEAKSLGSASFSAKSTKSVAFQPQLVSTANVNTTSTSDAFMNGLMFSKPHQPEAVPTKNIFKVGASDDRIKRIIALREGLFIFKERGGCYVLRGEGESTFSYTLLDNTAKLVAPDSLAIVNNLAYGLFEAGICEVSDTGVSIISTPIKDQLLPLFGAPLEALKTYSFGIANDIDGKYILSIPAVSTDTSTNKQCVFDTFGRSFCTWTKELTCGGVNPVDAKLYLGQPGSAYILSERRAFDHTDYADFGSTCTISSYSGTTLYIDNTSLMANGDILFQGTDAIAYVESVDTLTGTVVIDTEQDWTLNTADVTHMKAIECKIQWNPDSAGNAAGLKQFYECSLIAKQSFQKSATLYFSSDVNPAESSILITSSSGNGSWGQFAFGDEAFGGEQVKAPKRLGVPRTHARCSSLSVRFETKVAYSDFQITGLALSFIPTSTRTTR